jgi:hypothetical protein
MDVSIELVKPAGHILYMDSTEAAPESWFKNYLERATCTVTHHENFTYYSGTKGVPSEWWKMVAISGFSYHCEMEGYAYLLKRP